ncbi:hypothetical protein DSO57_1039629 [Entomophthora muscae]|uniref:Uncharacterized protein n=1 Tax=Entomophthora muscae TaxID=34485 RepID=A0ACC2UTT4_9FUNG|nr:hypothetical protein DSO57_1039629 [Entomophthora muscae]
MGKFFQDPDDDCGLFVVSCFFNESLKGLTGGIRDNVVLWLFGVGKQLHGLSHNTGHRHIVVKCSNLFKHLLPISGLEIMWLLAIILPFVITHVRLICDVKDWLHLLHDSSWNTIAAVYRVVYIGHSLSGDIIYCSGCSDLSVFSGKLPDPGTYALCPCTLCPLSWLCQCNLTIELFSLVSFLSRHLHYTNSIF